MTSIIQLYSLALSFVYGIFFCILSKLNFKIIDSMSRFLRYILTFLFVMDMVIIYIILIYKLNKGYFHMYFVLLVFCGYLIANILLKNIRKFDVNHILGRLKNR